jgi:hypothetical protein
MTRSRFGLSKERLVPIEAAWNVSDADDRPYALHCVSGVGLISLVAGVRYFGTKSLGLSDPPPNRNFSISATKNARALGSIGVRRFSLISVV